MRRLCITLIGACASLSLLIPTPAHAVPSEGGASEAAVTMDHLYTWIAQLTGADYVAQVEGEQIGGYIGTIQAEQAAQRGYRAPQVASRPSAGSAVGACTGFPIPDWIIQRESGGDPNAYNASSGAIGCSQTLISHYNTGGPCGGLDPHTVDGQRACTQILYDRGGLAPWAG